MNTNTATKLAEIMTKAAKRFAAFSGCEFQPTYEECVGIEFWRAFGRYEQSLLMQDVYLILCGMGMTPLEVHQQ